jgi:hypothetical protein
MADHRIYFRPQDQRLLEALEAHQRGNFLPNTNAALNHALSLFFFGGNPPPSPIAQPLAQTQFQPPSMSTPSAGFEPDGWD